MYTHNFFIIKAFSKFLSCSPYLSDISLTYLLACDLLYKSLKNILLALFNDYLCTMSFYSLLSLFPSCPCLSSYHSIPTLPCLSSSPNHSSPVAIFTTKQKYKPVSLKVCPVLTDLSNKFCIVCHIQGDPLADIPTLLPNLPPFTLTKWYTIK